MRGACFCRLRQKQASGGFAARTRFCLRQNRPPRTAALSPEPRRLPKWEKGRGIESREAARLFAPCNVRCRTLKTPWLIHAVRLFGSLVFKRDFAHISACIQHCRVIIRGCLRIRMNVDIVYKQFSLKRRRPCLVQYVKIVGIREALIKSGIQIAQTDFSSGGCRPQDCMKTTQEYLMYFKEFSCNM